MLPGGPSGAPAHARAESGRPQNWSPAISGSPKPLKINEKSIFSAQNTSKTYCNLPRTPWKRQKASWSRRNALWRTLQRPGARARGDWPATKLVPGDFWQPKTIRQPTFGGAMGVLNATTSFKTFLFFMPSRLPWVPRIRRAEQAPHGWGPLLMYRLADSGPFRSLSLYPLADKGLGPVGDPYPCTLWPFRRLATYPS